MERHYLLGVNIALKYTIEKTQYQLEVKWLVHAPAVLLPREDHWVSIA
jgi:hypothetical protein